jgi:flagellar basal-body rod protein FlgC
MRYVRIPVVTFIPLMALFCVAGCAGSLNQPAQVTVIASGDHSAADLVHYLDSRQVPLQKTGDGSTRIKASAQCREALIRFMQIARLRMDACASNIASQNTSRDADGKPMPYRRRIVVIGADGEAQMRLDDSPFSKRYLPGHPDADEAGMVLFPNVDISIEYAAALAASRDYELAAEVLRRLDPSIVVSDLDSTAAFEESD